MILRALVLTLLFATSVSAQPLLLMHAGKSGVTGGAGAQYLGDLLGTTGTYYGIRAFTAAEAAAGTQKMINVLRTSDSHTCDILVSNTGGMGNTANCSTGGDNGESVATWLSATTGRVETWYARGSGGGCNLAGGGSSAPTLSLSPAGIAFDSTVPENMSCTLGAAINTPFTYIQAANLTGANSSVGTLVMEAQYGSGANAEFQALFWNPTSGVVTAETASAGSFGLANASGTVTANNSGAVAATFTSAPARTGYLTATAGTPNTTNINPTTENNLSVGIAQYQSTQSLALGGTIFELYIVPSTVSGSNITAACHNEYTYGSTNGWGLPSC